MLRINQNLIDAFGPDGSPMANDEPQSNLGRAVVGNGISVSAILRSMSFQIASFPTKNSDKWIVILAFRSSSNKSTLCRHGLFFTKKKGQLEI